jgi:hypothetical protein
MGVVDAGPQAGTSAQATRTLEQESTEDVTIDPPFAAPQHPRHGSTWDILCLPSGMGTADAVVFARSDSATSLAFTGVTR